jgi:hypothetical protein
VFVNDCTEQLKRVEEELRAYFATRSFVRARVRERYFFGVTNGVGNEVAIS